MERFWRTVSPPDHEGCWVWLGATGNHGYGRAFIDGRLQAAHRVAYVALVGAIPAGKTLDHLCRNRLCVNPAHLEPVTNRENVLRGVGPTAQNARKTHCKRGHEFTPENTKPASGGRACRACIRMADAVRRQKKRARAAATAQAA